MIVRYSTLASESTLLATPRIRTIWSISSSIARLSPAVTKFSAVSPAYEMCASTYPGAVTSPPPSRRVARTKADSLDGSDLPARCPARIAHGLAVVRAGIMLRVLTESLVP